MEGTTPASRHWPLLASGPEAQFSPVHAQSQSTHIYLIDCTFVTTSDLELKLCGGGTAPHASPRLQRPKQI